MKLSKLKFAQSAVLMATLFSLLLTSFPTQAFAAVAEFSEEYSEYTEDTARGKVLSPPSIHWPTAAFEMQAAPPQMHHHLSVHDTFKVVTNIPTLYICSNKGAVREADVFFSKSPAYKGNSQLTLLDTDINHVKKLVTFTLRVDHVDTNDPYFIALVQWKYVHEFVYHLNESIPADAVLNAKGNLYIQKVDYEISSDQKKIALVNWVQKVDVADRVLFKDSQIPIDAIVTPNNAYDKKIAGFVSSNNPIASVTKVSDTSAKLFGKEVGSVVISAISNGFGKTAAGTIQRLKGQTHAKVIDIKQVYPIISLFNPEHPGIDHKQEILISAPEGFILDNSKLHTSLELQGANGANMSNYFDYRISYGVNKIIISYNFKMDTPDAGLKLKLKLKYENETLQGLKLYSEKAWDYTMKLYSKNDVN